MFASHAGPAKAAAVAPTPLLHFDAALVDQALHGGAPRGADAADGGAPAPRAAEADATNLPPAVVRAARRAAARSRAAVASRGRQQTKRRFLELTTIAFVASILLSVGLPSVLNPPNGLTPAVIGDGDAGAAVATFLWFMASMTAGSSVVVSMLCVWRRAVRRRRRREGPLPPCRPRGTTPLARRVSRDT